MLIESAGAAGLNIVASCRSVCVEVSISDPRLSRTMAVLLPASLYAHIQCDSPNNIYSSSISNGFIIELIIFPELLALE